MEVRGTLLASTPSKKKGDLTNHKFYHDLPLQMLWSWEALLFAHSLPTKTTTFRFSGHLHTSG